MNENTLKMREKRRIKLLFVIPSAQIGGSERVFLNLLKGLNRNKFDIHLIIIDPRGPLLGYVPKDVSIYLLGCDRVGRAVFRIAAALRKVKPDVLFTSIGHMNLAVLLIKPLIPEKTKVFIRESNMPSQAFFGSAKYHFFLMLYRFLYPAADVIVCPGEGIKRELRERFKIKPNKMIVIPNAVREKEIHGGMGKSVRLFEVKNLNLVASGSLTRQKGFDLLIRAMSKLVKKRPEIHLTIRGDGPDRRDLEEEIQRLGLSDKITLAGFQDDPYPFLYQADLFVLSSRWEGLPNVVLESLCCGTPVIAFDCPGCVREIFDDPSQGTLVTAGNVDALAKAIEGESSNFQSRPKVSLLPKRFNQEDVISRYEGLFGWERACG